MERDHFEDPGIDGNIILRWSSERGRRWHGLDWSGSG